MGENEVKTVWTETRKILNNSNAWNLYFSKKGSYPSRYLDKISWPIESLPAWCRWWRRAAEEHCSCSKWRRRSSNPRSRVRDAPQPEAKIRIPGGEKQRLFVGKPDAGQAKVKLIGKWTPSISVLLYVYGHETLKTGHCSRSVPQLLIFSWRGWL